MLSVREGAARVQPQASGAPVDEHEAAGILLAWFRKFYAGLLEQLLDKFDSDGKPKPMYLGCFHLRTGMYCHRVS